MNVNGIFNLFTVTARHRYCYRKPDCSTTTKYHLVAARQSGFRQCKPSEAVILKRVRTGKIDNQIRLNLLE